MNEWWLMGILIVLTLCISVLMIHPLRLKLKYATVLLVLMSTFVSVAYYTWGAFAGWQQYMEQTHAHKLAKNLMKTIKGPQELIRMLKAKLQDNPESAKGWYLLGRLYSSQNDIHNAVDAFRKAYHFKPNDEAFAVNYAHSLWLDNQRQFNPEIIRLFKEILKSNPKQPDALAMLAMDAYIRHAYNDAIEFWHQLLKLTPGQSKEALAIRRAIARAEQFRGTTHDG